jgi:hypothetical protein
MLNHKNSIKGTKGGDINYFDATHLSIMASIFPQSEKSRNGDDESRDVKGTATVSNTSTESSQQTDAKISK